MANKYEMMVVLSPVLGDEGITSTTDVSVDNLTYIKRISALEKALAKVGINPNSVE